MSTFEINLSGNVSIISGLQIMNDAFMPEDRVLGAIYATMKVNPIPNKTMWDSYLNMPSSFKMNGRDMKKCGFDADTNQAHYQGNP